MGGSDAQMLEVLKWLEANGIHKDEHFDEVTHVKPAALVYIDDRPLHLVGWDQALADFSERYRLS